MLLSFVRTLRILDFDLETIAAGFADPEWVPQKITCAAWSWVGAEEVTVATCGGSTGLYETPSLRRGMLLALGADMAKADMVTGHNLLRFDLPVLNADRMRLGLAPLGPVMVQDTMRIPRGKGLKKGQDNLATMLETYEQKLTLSWAEWEKAYATPGWPVVRARARSDVVMHKELRALMLDRGMLKAPRVWYP